MKDGTVHKVCDISWKIISNVAPAISFHYCLNVAINNVKEDFNQRKKFSRERWRKRPRDGSSQPNEADYHDVREHCHDTNAGLSHIDEKLGTLSILLPEFKAYKKVNDREQKKRNLKNGIEDY